MTIIVNDKEVLIDDEDYFLIEGRRITLLKQRHSFYAYTRGKRLHRLIMGITDPKITVDHKNGNPLDNRKQNLRICTQAQNTKNRSKSPNLKCSSKHKGVFAARGKWAAQIKVNYKVIFLGYHKEEENAAKAYNEAAIIHFGEFAKLNII